MHVTASRLHADAAPQCLPVSGAAGTALLEGARCWSRLPALLLCCLLAGSQQLQLPLYFLQQEHLLAAVARLSVLQHAAVAPAHLSPLCQLLMLQLLPHLHWRPLPGSADPARLQLTCCCPRCPSCCCPCCCPLLLMRAVLMLLGCCPQSVPAAGPGSLRSSVLTEASAAVACHLSWLWKACRWTLHPLLLVPAPSSRLCCCCKLHHPQQQAAPGWMCLPAPGCWLLTGHGSGACVQMSPCW